MRGRPLAVVDVRGLDRDTGELRYQVVLLVRDTGRREETDLVGLVAFQLGGNELDGLVPARLDELAVLLDERLGQPVGRIDELPGIVPLRAEFALVDGVPVPRRYADDLLVLHDKVEAATGPAIGTGRLYILYVHGKTSDTEISLQNRI
jgi:hypothetical protein